MLDFMKFKKHRIVQIDEDVSIKDSEYIVVDTELTGLDERKDSIVSIGAVKMIGTKIDVGDTFYRLVNSHTELSAKSVVLHGITPSEVVEEPDIEKILSEFLLFCKSDVIVGHFISIDLMFINKEMKRIFGSPIKNHVLDTFTLYQWIMQSASSDSSYTVPFKDTNLYEIAANLSIPVSGTHNAITDAFITAQVFQRFIPMLYREGIRRIGDLLQVGNPSKGGDKFKVAGELGNL